MPLSLWGGLDPASGRVIDRHHPLFGEFVGDRVLSFPMAAARAPAPGSQGSFYLDDAVREMAAIAWALEKERGAVRATAFRDRIGTGCKLAIQILEFFDRVGFTRRIGDERWIRRADFWDA